MEHYKLPNGSYTYNADEFADKWKAFYQPIEDIFDIYVRGFDPGFAITDKTHLSKTADIPMWLAKRLNELAESKLNNDKDTYTTIVVFYWMGSKPKGLSYTHNVPLKYSYDLQNKIIEDCLNLNYQVMLKKGSSGVLLIQVDNGNFRQR